MKKYFNIFLIIILSVLAVPFVSCSDDNDEPEISSKSVVGTWELVSELAEALGMQEYIQLKEDGVFYRVVLISEEMIPLYGESTVEKGNWILDNNIIKYSFETSPDDVGELIIKKITSNEMVCEELGVTAKLKRVSDDIVNEMIEESGVSDDW